MVDAQALDVTIRSMRISDVDAVYDIERQTFPDPWARNAFGEGLGEDWSVCYVAVAHGSPIGYVCAVGVADELHIHNLAVHPSFRGRGIGPRLLATAEGWARRHGKLCALLDVRESNAPARSLYEKAGYEPIGRRKRYYRKPAEDALVLMKNLSGDGSSA